MLVMLVEVEDSMAKEAAINKDEQIGIHKGALSTLAKERQELKRLVTVVEQLMHMHIQELKSLGVDLEKAAQEVAEKKKKTSERDD